MTEYTITRPTAASVTPTPAIFMRKCACGGAPGMSGACDDFRENQLQRKSTTTNSHGAAAVSVSAALRAPGEPLDGGTRAYMESRFGQYFDPSGSGDIDEGFVRDGRQKYRFIRGNMRSLRFDCDPGSWTLCGASKRWCTGGRLMWTCFGALHVCSAAYKAATPDFKIETIIHESVHNALLTTDRAYSNEADFKKLKPREGGFWGSVLNFLGKIPVLGILFRSLPGNNDTINNPDSYAGYAMQV
jgi:hypothetical protein